MIVLDASALLALMLEEPGGEIVAESIGDTIISAANLGETAQRMFAKSQWSRAQFEHVIAALEIDTVPVDPGLAIDAAEMFLLTRQSGLSYADRLCLALAKQMNAIAMTADRAWAEVGEAIGVEVRLIR